MTILQIYKKYQIMPQLQLHQFRVAAVAHQIAVNRSENLDIYSIVAACLLHDMGNIIKFDLEYFPEFLEPEGLRFWESVKEDFIRKYGSNEHDATEQIVKELAVSDSVLQCVKSVGFSNVIKVQANGSLEQKICSYADQRVGPYGVLTLEQRLEEGQGRYAKHPHKVRLGTDGFAKSADALRAIEAELFDSSAASAGEITEASSQSIIESLKNFEL